jgi:hypothetical protein
VQERAIARVEAKGHEPNFKSNSALIHAAVFGFIKDKIGSAKDVFHNTVRSER